jgi:hypothetical protein
VHLPEAEPVDIPQAETRTLKDVLELPWGFEIYSLLTRWNPLNLRRPLPLAPTGKRVLVVGMGPSGFTLAHHLMNDGHRVVGIDGLKIEPLDPRRCRASTCRAARRVRAGPRRRDAPGRPRRTHARGLRRRRRVRHHGALGQELPEAHPPAARTAQRVQPVRRRALRRHDDTVDDAFGMGFDHIALCAGAGKPTILDMPERSRARRAHRVGLPDGAAAHGRGQAGFVANMQLRLPVVVDRRRPDRRRHRHRVDGVLPAAGREVPAALRDARRRTAKPPSARAGAPRSARSARSSSATPARIRAERAAAAAEGRDARIAELLQSWGGVTLAYRRKLIDSPAYTLNHEEIEKALEEGIRFAENLTPVSSPGSSTACRTSRCTRRRRRACASLSMEGLALTGAWTDPRRGCSR